MKKRLTLLILLTIVVVGFCFFRKQISYEIYRKINIISAGSYPYAETYNLNYSESEVKNAIKKLKELHPEYNVPKNIGEYELNDHQTKNPAFWYVTFFYFQGENEVIQTWIRNNGKSETTFAFVQVNQIRTNSWKNINDDFNYKDSSNQIDKFEKRILNVLIEILKTNKGNR